MVSSFLAWLSQRYDTPDKKLKANRGSTHDYLGMKIEFAQRGSVKFDMIPYIDKIINDFPE